MGRKRRLLSCDDAAVWQAVTRTVTPLTAAKPKPPPGDDAAGRPAGNSPPVSRTPAPTPEPRAPFSFRPRQEPFVSIRTVPDPMAPRGAPPRMDAKAFTRMQRGRLEPEGRLDLHGMFADDAHRRLRQFLVQSHGSGRRLVLVITGKGREAPGLAPERRGVLRTSLPVWLAQPPLDSIVLDYAPAHQRHGGRGAWYIYLRRRK